MDNWQKHVSDKCLALLEEDFKYVEGETTISVNSREAYVIIKALEDQQRYLNPLIEVESPKDD